MKNLTKLLIIFFAISLFYYSSVYAAGSSGADDNYDGSLYKQGKKLMLRAKKLEKKK